VLAVDCSADLLMERSTPCTTSDTMQPTIWRMPKHCWLPEHAVCGTKPPRQANYSSWRQLSKPTFMISIHQYVCLIVLGKQIAKPCFRCWSLGYHNVSKIRLISNSQINENHINIHSEQHRITIILKENKKLSCRRETTWRFMSPNMLLSHLRFTQGHAKRQCFVGRV